MQPHIRQFAEGMRMAFAAFPSKGPDVSVRTELVGLSAVTVTVLYTAAGVACLAVLSYYTYCVLSYPVFNQYNDR